MKNLKLLLFSLLLISTLAQCQTTPPLKLRSADSFTQVDHFLNVKKRFGIPFSSTNNLFCNGSYPLMFNTTEGKLKLYNGASWINPFSLNLQEVLNNGNSVLNSSITLNSNTFNNPQAEISPALIGISNPYYSYYLNPLGLSLKNISGYARLSPNTGLTLKTSSITNFGATIKSDLITSVDKFLQLPDVSGTLITDAPIDNTSYIRYNGTWLTNPTNSFQSVLDVNNVAMSFNSNPAFYINQGSSYSTQFNAEHILFSDNTVNNNRQAFVGFDGFMSETDNGGKKVMLTTADGLTLKTSLTGFTGTMLSNLLTANRTYQLPNESGTLVVDAPSNGTSYVRKDGGWVPNSGGSRPTLQNVTDVRNITTNSIRVNLTDDGVSDGPDSYGNSSELNYNGLSVLNGNSELTLRAGNNDSKLKIVENQSLGYVEMNASNPSIKASSGHRDGFAYTGIFPEHIVFRNSAGIESRIKTDAMVGMSYGDWIFPRSYGKISIINTNAPHSANDTGVVGEIRVTPTYIYICTATDTWVRSAVATW